MKMRTLFFCGLAAAALSCLAACSEKAPESVPARDRASAVSQIFAGIMNDSIEQHRSAGFPYVFRSAATGLVFFSKEQETMAPLAPEKEFEPFSLTRSYHAERVDFLLVSETVSPPEKKKDGRTVSSLLVECRVRTASVREVPASVLRSATAFEWQKMSAGERERFLQDKRDAYPVRQYDFQMVEKSLSAEFAESTVSVSGNLVWNPATGVWELEQPSDIRKLENLRHWKSVLQAASAVPGRMAAAGWTKEADGAWQDPEAAANLKKIAAGYVCLPGGIWRPPGETAALERCRKAVEFARSHPDSPVAAKRIVDSLDGLPPGTDVIDAISLLEKNLLTRIAAASVRSDPAALEEIAALLEYAPNVWSESSRKRIAEKLEQETAALARKQTLDRKIYASLTQTLADCEKDSESTAALKSFFEQAELLPANDGSLRKAAFEFVFYSATILKQANLLRLCSDRLGAENVPRPRTYSVDCPDCEKGRARCKACGGQNLCPVCHGAKGKRVRKSGTGISIRGTSDALKDGTEHWVVCRTCNGTGTKKCVKCDGTGRVPCVACGATGLIPNPGKLATLRKKAIRSLYDLLNDKNH